MPGILKDKYFLFCLLVSVIVIVSVNLNGSVEEGYVGIVTDVNESANGFVFILNDTDGNRIKCFCREEPETDAVYLIKGDFSDDNTILFISSMSVL